MIKRILLILPLIGASLLLSGCSFSGVALKSKNTMANATFLKSEDSGGSWNLKMKIDDKKNIAGIDVLTMAVKPGDPNVVYLGTSSNGLFASKDGGETWAQQSFADKAYGLVFDPVNPDIMYASGVLNGRAKIYKRIVEGEEWKEIYTEPADGTTISSLAISPFNPRILYAGTSNGVIVKSTDAGQNWINLKLSYDANFNSPITNIAFDSSNDSHILFASFQTGILETRNGGESIENITKQMDPKGNTASIYTLVADPYLGGTFYAGTGSGIFRRNGDGGWSPLNIIESSKAYPIRSITINPRNSREIIYSSAKAIYKSTDGGNRWSTFQLDTSKDISIIRYNPQDPTRIYAGLRGF